MIKAWFIGPARACYSLNGWTFGHMAHWFMFSSFFMIRDLVAAQKEVQALLCSFLLVLTFFKVSKAPTAMLWTLIFVLYLSAVSFWQTFFLAWPAAFLYLGMLAKWGLGACERFFLPMNLFETYRSLLAVAVFSSLALLGPWDTLFFALALMWSSFLLISGLLWKIRFPQFLPLLESCIVVSSLGMFYSLFSSEGLSNSSALFFMMAMSSWNFLVWPARRQEKASLEKWQWTQSSQAGLGWALFLRLEQWRSTPIFFSRLSDDCTENCRVLDENRAIKEMPEAAWYLMRSAGGIWSLWARVFEKMPRRLQKAAVWLIEQRIKVSEKELSEELRALIKERERA